MRQMRLGSCGPPRAPWSAKEPIEVQLPNQHLAALSRTLHASPRLLRTAAGHPHGPQETRRGSVGETNFSTALLRTLRPRRSSTTGMRLMLPTPIETRSQDV